MFFRIEGWVQTPTGLAVPGASAAILDQPADFSTQPGTPLAEIFSADTSNSTTITAAAWSGQEIDFTFTTVPDDVVPGSFFGIDSALPIGYNNPAWEVLSVVGDVVTVAAIANPGTYVSGGNVTTSTLPNPVQTDGNGYWFAYAAAGIYSVQIYGDNILEIDYPDQGVGTVAGGSVSSVALTMPGIFAVGGSPVTTAGTIAVTLANVNANLVFAGPVSGGAAAPTFRALVSADFPSGVGTVQSVAASLTAPAIFTPSVTGSPVTASGTLALALALVPQNANAVWAGPTSGGTGNPAFRALVFADLPVLPYDIHIFNPGVGSDAQIVYVLPLSAAVTFPAGAANSYGVALTAATASATYTFKKNGSAFATAVFAISGTVATWTQASDAVFAGGDVLEVTGPATHDGTLANFAFSLAGNL
jgi:hypothetical protein